jgi:hypothetical protein
MITSVGRAGAVGRFGHRFGGAQPDTTVEGTWAGVSVTRSKSHGGGVRRLIGYPSPYPSEET